MPRVASVCVLVAANTGSVRAALAQAQNKSGAAPSCAAQSAVRAPRRRRQPWPGPWNSSTRRPCRRPQRAVSVGACARWAAGGWVGACRLRRDCWAVLYRPGLGCAGLNACWAAARSPACARTLPTMHACSTADQVSTPRWSMHCLARPILACVCVRGGRAALSSVSVGRGWRMRGDGRAPARRATLRAGTRLQLRVRAVCTNNKLGQGGLAAVLRVLAGGSQGACRPGSNPDPGLPNQCAPGVWKEGQRRAAAAAAAAAGAAGRCGRREQQAGGASSGGVCDFVMPGRVVCLVLYRVTRVFILRYAKSPTRVCMLHACARNTFLGARGPLGALARCCLDAVF